MARDGTGPDFIEALARGLEVITAFRPGRAEMTLADLAGATGLARPTVRRVLLTLTELGYVRSGERGYALTPRVLDLGVAYVRSTGLWDVARPHLERLVARTHESCSIAQLDGSDIVYVARVAVPKIVALSVQISAALTLFSLLQTEALPLFKFAIPPSWWPWITAVVGFLIIVARVLQQQAVQAEADAAIAAAKSQEPRA